MKSVAMAFYNGAKYIDEQIRSILDNMEEAGFNITLYEAGWYQQAMQYFERCYLKNGLEDLEKGIVTMQFVVDSMKERLKNE